MAHIYQKDGMKYASVTTILDILGAPKGLMKWANHLGFKRMDYETFLNLKADYGTIVHSSVAKFFYEGAETPIAPTSIAMKDDINGILTHLEVMKKNYEIETIFSEKTLISPTLGYAGTLDWLVKLNGVIYLIDFKTSKDVHLKMLLQLSAYRELLRDQCPEYQVDHAGILLLDPKKCTLVEFTKEMLDRAYPTFLDIKTLYESHHKLTDYLQEECMNTVGSGKLPKSILN